ncbi:MAG: 2-octaprenyl-6-methoxyphenyl hydroxylase [Gammaproteobacteria bacterium]|nr:2-octaprenyl-6-methoxyphenyl hydroxylase [Gammaproteobacteria bacterium]MCW8958316.1 2-octaprenyl-6-methoxyphenyl hydroxylase [Gammaproteobacteria bacterium]MCW8972706.1 2-octaprenyl-6-methoxyphenyl hydroxylase [Gammaproteobacteria bacterium]MCW8992329.1 2-octaprenyl-6-methoxyphenyl hydroxylase [Gammaproteobacteria bacterium]
MDYDILVIGGGMVGASLVHALRDSGLRIGLVEAVPLYNEGQPSYDARAIALSWGSRRIFEGMGVWQAMAQQTVTPIRAINVSDRGHFGATRLQAEEEGVEALGYVAEAAVIGRALGSGLAELPGVTIFCPATLTAIRIDEEAATVTLDQEGEQKILQARLVVAADGGRSTVREQLGAKTVRLGYGQTAVVASVISDRSHDNVAFERFTDSGPLALLPNTAPQWMTGSEHGDRRWSMVWTAREDQVDELLALDDAAFLERLQGRLGRRAGRLLAVTPRSAYPLGLQYVRDHVRPRLAFIGNAAHLIHPVGGQGFNLGLRDVAVLAEVLAQAAHQGGDPGVLETLQGYARWRRGDYLRVMGVTDSLVRIFSNDFRTLVVARNAGMVAMDLMPPLRRLFTRQAMGVNGRQPRLALGLPLNDRK